jgi:glycosyltransferase involved in cell wall biosynthesis
MGPIKIAYIAAGAGGMYCGNCLHDNTLAAAMTRQGHNVHLVPTYTPLKTDEDNVSLKRVFFGGVNVYLDQKYPWYRRLPSWATGWLNQPWLLNLVVRMSVSTRAEDLGALAVSMLRGEEGYQKREIDELVDWLATEAKPDVVHLSNVLLIGLARTIRERLGVPVIVTLSGEDLFLEQLKEPHTSQALFELRHRAGDVQGFVALNRYYADRCTELLQIEPSKMHVIPHGLALTGHGTRIDRPSDSPFTLGYLGRIVPEKGVDRLVDAFIRLNRESDLPPLRLRLAGYLSPADKKYLRQMQDAIKRAGLADKFEYVGSPDRQGKIDFLLSLDTLAMPCVYPESKGLPIIEALANGVPVVVPHEGAFPEAIAESGGGLTYLPNDLDQLTASLLRMIAEPGLADTLRKRGRESVHREHSDALMAERTIRLYESILASHQHPAETPSEDAPRQPERVQA